MTTPQAELPPSEATHATATVTLPKPNDGYRWVLQTEAALPQEPAADSQRVLASLADTVAEAIRNTCSMPHPNIGLHTDLRPYIWSLSYEANAQKKRADEREALAAPLNEAQQPLVHPTEDVAAMRADAKRYRTKRDIDMQRMIGTPAYCSADPAMRKSMVTGWLASYDAAIDAAMASSDTGATSEGEL